MCDFELHSWHTGIYLLHRLQAVLNAAAKTITGLPARRTSPCLSVDWLHRLNATKRRRRTADCTAQPPSPTYLPNQLISWTFFLVGAYVLLPLHERSNCPSDMTCHCQRSVFKIAGAELRNKLHGDVTASQLLSAVILERFWFVCYIMICTARRFTITVIL